MVSDTPAPDDASTTDASTTDASTTDASTTDASTTDASTTDASTTDASTTDSSTTDSSTTDASTTDASTSDHRRLDRPLPSALAARLAELFELDARPKTVATWVDDALAAITRVQGRDIAVGDLCHADDGPHVARCDGETYGFVCVLDAFVLAGLTDEPVAIESPDQQTGEILELTVAPDGRATAPEGAVVSLGVARDVPDGPLSPAKTYGALCPYVHAFASEATYQAWAETTDAETTPLTVEEAAAAARILAGTA